MTDWKKVVFDCLKAGAIAVGYSVISGLGGSPEWFSRSFAGLIYLIAYFHFEGKE